MPIYEFVCLECHTRFEELVMGGRRIACPKCRGSSVKKLFSSFSFSSVGKDGMSSPKSGVACGSCKPSSTKCKVCK